MNMRERQLIRDVLEKKKIRTHAGDFNGDLSTGRRTLNNTFNSFSVEEDNTFIPYYKTMKVVTKRTPDIFTTTMTSQAKTSQSLDYGNPEVNRSPNLLS